MVTTASTLSDDLDEMSRTKPDNKRGKVIRLINEHGTKIKAARANGWSWRAIAAKFRARGERVSADYLRKTFEPTNVKRQRRKGAH